MLRHLPLAVVFLPFALACAGTGGSAAGGAPGPVTDSATVVGPTTGLEVTVALASAHLGDERCTHDESADVTTKSCASRPPDAGPPGTGPCGGPCDYSRVQLTFTTKPEGRTTPIAVTSATIVDAATGAELQALSVSTPLAWDGIAYRPWDETVSPAAQRKASYTLSPPGWSTFGANVTSRAYKVRVGVRVDGQAVVLESAEIHREPVAST